MAAVPPPQSSAIEMICQSTGAPNLINSYFLEKKMKLTSVMLAIDVVDPPVYPDT